MNKLFRKYLLPGFAAAALTACVSAPPGPAPTPAPVSWAADGFSAAEAYALKAAYSKRSTASGGDQNLYMYLNMAQFFPHQVVPRAGPVRELPLRQDAAIGAIVATTGQGSQSLDAMLEDPHHRVQGFVVVHQGRIVYERYPGMRPDDNHLWWSSAKVLPGLLAAMLVAEGKLDADKPVEFYLPEFIGSGWQGTTIRNLADHASGINAEEINLESYISPKSELSRLILAEGILDPPFGKAPTHDEALRSMTRKRPQGEAYEYSSANANLLGLVLERVSGRRFADLLADRVWSRMGAEGDALMGVTPQGNAIAHGMFSSRLRDMARFGMLFTPSGRKGADAVVSDKVLRMIQQDLRPDLYRESQKRAGFATTLGEAPVACSWQWDAVFEDGDLLKGGFHGQALYVSPARDLVIAFFATSNENAPYAYLRPIATSKLLAGDARKY